MKVFKKLTVLGFACLFVMACSEKQPATIGQADQTDLEKKPAPMAQVEKTETQALSQTVAPAPTEIAGTLMQTEKGLAIVTGTDIYVVTGQDMSDMIGQTVKVTGAVAEVDGGQVIEVMTVAPLE